MGNGLGQGLAHSLRSAREWNKELEEAGVAARWTDAAGAEERARRLEQMLAAARTGGLKSERKARRTSMARQRENLGLQEAVIARAIQFLQRRQVAGEFLEDEWRALTGNIKVLEESFAESRAALKAAEELPILANGSAEPRVRARAVADRYLQAAIYLFERSEFIAFLAALQEEVELTNAEIASLKGFLSLVLLEQVADLARKVAMPGRTSNDGKKASVTAPRLVAMIGSLKALGLTDWDEVFVEASLSEQTLARDPAGAYQKMEKSAKADYRNEVAELAKKSGESEAEVARRAVALASQRFRGTNARANERRSHVGFYLIREGREKLEVALGIKHSVFVGIAQFLRRWPDGLYVIGIELVMVALLTAVVVGAEVSVPIFLVAGLFLLPAAESAVTIVNLLTGMFVKPLALPKMDFSEGIPAESKTLVVVPTLLTSKAQMERAVRDLEIRFLGNRDEHLHFALLTDPPDATTQYDKRDELAVECAALIDKLNQRYALEGKGTFFLFHRDRTFNELEKVWMGWERKRGKLLDLNNFLLGKENKFSILAGQQSLLGGVKYAITLDADTQLPRDAGRKLVGAIAHPLQRAVVDANSNVVVEGYGILQPRVGISIHSANRSRLAAFFSGDSSFDVYTRAVSDVYQDLFAEGSFTGKGIYEVEVFQQVVEHRFPSNAILSHDMIEGAYARAGLLSDVEVIDDYPSRTAAYSKRKHRWVRGDWQILFWLFPRVPDYYGRIVRNPINLISRWKILDNLRRSLTEISMLAILISGWLFLPGRPLYWTLATLAIFVSPTYLQFLFSVLRSGKNKFTPGFWKAWWSDFVSANAHLLLRLASLPQQSLVTLDAIVRAAARMAVTRRKLLEWETAAEAEGGGEKTSPVDFYLKATPWLAILGGAALALIRPDSFRVAWPLLVLWCASDAFSFWLDQPLPEDGLRISVRDEALLRDSALRTWRFFREFGNENENYLIPDILKEEGGLIAHRVSTTNLGLLLNARIAAVDLGYITLPEFISGTENTLNTVRKLAKSHGHLFNWYDTRTLEPVGDPFLSTVDNGNLVCCLWTLKQAAAEECKRKIFRKELWTGIRDHIRLVQLLAGNKESRKACRAIEDYIAKMGDEPLHWVQTLPKFAEMIQALCEAAKSQTSESPDLQWWISELRLRAAELEKLVVQFAPWTSDKLALQQIRSDSEARWVADLTLENAEQIYAEVLAHAKGEADSALTERVAGAADATLRETLIAIRENALQTAAALQGIATYCDELATGMSFALVYDKPQKLITIGFDDSKGAASEHHYDLLASEARAAVFAGVAKGEIPQDSWFHLDRSHISYKGLHILQSWTGTMFEYLMPSLWMKSAAGTLLDRNMRNAVTAQQKYAGQFGIPWGISESGCSLISGDGHYHYFAFGVPALALHRPDEDRVVISPYSTFMSLMTGSHEALKNLHRLKRLGGIGSYGFYEALDYGPKKELNRKRFTMVRSWMAHHQGMCLLSVANVLCDSSIQRRFHAEPQVAATERILHERAIVPDAADKSKPKRKLKDEALLAKGQGALSSDLWDGSKDHAESTA